MKAIRSVHSGSCLSARSVRLSMLLLAPFASANDIPHGTVPDGRAAVLWYQKPAAKWEDAMPLGNGRLGAMVFGGVAEERVQLNETHPSLQKTRDAWKIPRECTSSPVSGRKTILTPPSRMPN